MPNNYANTANIVDGSTIDAVDVKAPIDSLDDQVKGMADAQYIVNATSAFLNNEITLATALASPPAIGTGTRNTGNFTTLLVDASPGASLAYVRAPAGLSKFLVFQTGTSDRWYVRANDTAESGGNAGTDFEVLRASDAGAILGVAMRLTRSNGNALFGANVTVTGALSKGSGTFKITHPLDANKWLRHGFIEAPRYDLIYRGRVQLSAGAATVSIDTASGMTAGTFAALTQNPQVFLQNDSGWSALKGSVSGGTLTITCENGSSTDWVNWMVVAERHDEFIRNNLDALTDMDGHLIVEQEKGAGDTLSPESIKVAHQ